VTVQSIIQHLTDNDGLLCHCGRMGSSLLDGMPSSLIGNLAVLW
jgi:hypothetical protein